MSHDRKFKETFRDMLNTLEEDIFDGNSPDEIPTSIMDAYNERCNRERGSLWEETV